MYTALHPTMKENREKETGFVFSHLFPLINEIGALKRMRRSSVKLSGLVKSVTKLVIGCLRSTEVAIFAVDG